MNGMDSSGAVSAAGLTHALMHHWPMYLSEGAALGTFMVSACALVALLEHPGSRVHRAIRRRGLRRMLIGLVMGLTAIALIYSPLGRLSGAHMNPATTMAFALLGKVALWDAAFYVIAQFLGAAAGVGLAALALRGAAAHPSVNYVATVPGRRGPRVAWAVELAISFIMMTMVLHVSNRATIAPYTGVIAGLLVAVYIATVAPLSGMSMNPARTLASAIFAGAWRPLWVYFTAPLVGMVAAAGLFVVTPGAGHVYCAKICHLGDETCPFLCEFDRLAPPHRPSAESRGQQNASHAK